MPAGGGEGPAGPTAAALEPPLQAHGAWAQNSSRGHTPQNVATPGRVARKAVWNSEPARAAPVGAACGFAADPSNPSQSQSQTEPGVESALRNHLDRATTSWTSWTHRAALRTTADASRGTVRSPPQGLASLEPHRRCVPAQQSFVFLSFSFSSFPFHFSFLFLLFDLVNKVSVNSHCRAQK
jgi:hypothetical protein